MHKTLTDSHHAKLKVPREFRVQGITEGLALNLLVLLKDDAQELEGVARQDAVELSLICADLAHTCVTISVLCGSRSNGGGQDAAALCHVTNGN